MRKLVLIGMMALVTWVSAEPTSGAIVIDTVPGTSAPPGTLGPYAMTPYARASGITNGTSVSSVTDLGLTLGFSPNVTKTTVGNLWLTWSHGYSNDIYFISDPSATASRSITMTLPLGTKAFYFYVEPSAQSNFAITATYAGGSPTSTLSISGNSGAQYFGFYGNANEDLSSIQVSAVQSAQGLAVGEFGINNGGGAIPEPSSLAIYGIGSCLTGLAVWKKRRQLKLPRVTVAELQGFTQRATAWVSQTLRR